MPIPSALENAYVLVLGYIAFVVERFIAVSFYDPTIFQSGLLTYSCVGLSIFIMTWNVISGWVSLRNFVSENPTSYTGTLFTIDLVLLLVFFIFSRIMMEVLPGGDSTVSRSSAIVTQGMQTLAGTFVLNALVLLSVLTMALYVAWNRCAKSAIDGMKKRRLLLHNMVLGCAGAILFAVLAGYDVCLSWPSSREIALGVLFSVWVVSWLVVYGIYLTSDKYVGQ